MHKYPTSLCFYQGKIAKWRQLNDLIIRQYCFYGLSIKGQKLTIRPCDDFKKSAYKILQNWDCTSQHTDTIRLSLSNGLHSIPLWCDIAQVIVFVKYYFWCKTICHWCASLYSLLFNLGYFYVVQINAMIIEVWNCIRIGKLSIICIII